MYTRILHLMSCQEPRHTSWFCSWPNSLESSWFRGKGGCIHNVGSLSLRGRSWRCCDCGFDWRRHFSRGPACAVPWGEGGGHMFISREFDTPICQPQSHVLAVATLYLSVKVIIPRCDSNCGTPGVDILETAEATAVVTGFSFFSHAGNSRAGQMKSGSHEKSFISTICDDLSLRDSPWDSPSFWGRSPRKWQQPSTLLVTPAFPVGGSLPLFSAASFSNLPTFGSMQSPCDICFPCPLGVNVLSLPNAGCGRMTPALGQHHLYVLTKREIIIQRDFYRSFCFLGESSAEPTEISATYFLIGGKIKPSNPMKIQFSSVRD